jgi:hypothetical protein
MKKSMKVAALVALAILLSPVAYPQKVNVDWDRNVQSFSTFKTYSWVKPLRPAPSPLMDQRIVAAIDSQLSAKGLQKGDGPAEVLVTYNAGIQRQRSAVAMGSGRWRMGGGMTTVNQTDSNVGTLVVDISDAKTKQLVWRGTASDTLSDQPDKNSKKIEKAVTKMFKKYPPQAK